MAVSDVDTSREAVEREKRKQTLYPGSVQTADSATAMFDALLARAEAAERLNNEHDTPAWKANEQLNTLVDQLAMERDAAIAERDAAAARADEAELDRDKAQAHAYRMEKIAKEQATLAMNAEDQRDAAIAERDRMREALEEARAVLIRVGFVPRGEWGKGDEEINRIDATLSAKEARNG